jgi:hypothetical protein
MLMSADVIAFPPPAKSLSITDQQLAELRAGVRRLPGDWRVDKVTLGEDCAYALLIPDSWGDGATGAFDIFRKGDALSLTDYRRTEFFGGSDDYQGSLCGVFASVEALCDALVDLVGTKRMSADQRDLGDPSTASRRCSTLGRYQVRQCCGVPLDDSRLCVMPHHMPTDHRALVQGARDP